MDSFKIISGLTLDPLQIREGIASFDREISFIKEVNKCFSNDLVYLQYGVERDLYTAKNIIQDFNNIYVVDVNSQPLETSSKTVSHSSQFLSEPGPACQYKQYAQLFESFISPKSFDNLDFENL